MTMKYLANQPGKLKQEKRCKTRNGSSEFVNSFLLNSIHFIKSHALVIDINYAFYTRNISRYDWHDVPKSASGHNKKNQTWCGLQSITSLNLGFTKSF